MTKNVDKVVTEADREAAMTFLDRYIAGWQEQGQAQRAAIEAFARHRISSIRAIADQTKGGNYG